MLTSDKSESALVLSGEVLINISSNLRTVLHRSFYLTLAVASAALYLLYEESSSSPASKVMRHFSDAFSATESVLLVNDVLYSDLTIIGNYSMFLEPFVAISSSSEQAIVAVDVQDNRWLSLDPGKRDLARSSDDSISWLQDRSTFYKGDNLRDLPLPNLKEMAKWLIFTDTAFDNKNGVRILKSQLYVAKELGQDVSDPEEWPGSFHFVDFESEKEDAILKSRLQYMREEFTMNDVIIGVDRLERLCVDNGIENCTPNYLKILLSDEPSKLDKAEQEKINISFIPLEIERELLFMFTPIILLILLFRFIGYGIRWNRLMIWIKSQYDMEGIIEEGVFWSIIDNIRPQLNRVRSPAGIVQGCVMFTFMNLVIFSPIIAQMWIFWHGINADWHESWIVIIFFLIVFSFIGLGKFIWYCWKK